MKSGTIRNRADEGQSTDEKTWIRILSSLGAARFGSNRVKLARGIKINRYGQRMLKFFEILSVATLMMNVWPAQSGGEAFEHGALLVLDFPIIAGSIPVALALGFATAHHSQRWVLIMAVALLGWTSLGYLWPQSSPTDNLGLPLGTWWRILFLPGVGAVLALALSVGFRVGPALCASLAALVGFCIGNLTGWFAIRGPGIPPDAGMAGSLFTFACAFVVGVVLGIRLKGTDSATRIQATGAGIALLAIVFAVWMGIRCVEYYRAGDPGSAWLAVSMRLSDYYYFYWTSVR